MAVEIPILIVKWETLVGQVLDATRDFPKSVRFTFSSRIDNLALDILDSLIQARWARGRGKSGALRQADLLLTRLRVILRLAHQRQYLPHRVHERLQEGIDEAGRMVGGWLRHLDAPTARS